MGMEKNKQSPASQLCAYAREEGYFSSILNDKKFGKSFSQFSVITEITKVWNTCVSNQKNEPYPKIRWTPIQNGV